MYVKVFKRMFDFGVAFLGLVALLPLLLILAIAIKLDSPGPVFFVQKRIGIHKRYFNILKFRTMCRNAPANTPTHQLSNSEQYITKLGKFLRRTSLDELPQIWNILIGQMSVIGPRPALWNQEDLIFERDKYGANDLRPGLTGWAQVHGRDELKIEDKAKLDGDYAKRISFILDLQCFILTIFSVIKQEGIIEGENKKS